jgi:hypothetical protein
VGFAHPLHIDAYCVGGHRRTLGTRGNRCLNLLVSQDSETLRLWNAESHIWPNTMGLRFQLWFLPRVSISFPSSIRVSSFSEGYPHSGSGNLFVRKKCDSKDDRFRSRVPAETNSKEPPICGLLHTHNAASPFSLGKVPDPYQRQNRGKNHEQTNRSPLSIWILHILLLAGGENRKQPIEAPENAFYLRSCGPTALLLVGHALNYKSLFFRVSQIIPRHNIGQAIIRFLASTSPSTAAIQSEVPSPSRLKMSNLECIPGLRPNKFVLSRTISKLRCAY